MQSRKMTLSCLFLDAKATGTQHLWKTVDSKCAVSFMEIPQKVVFAQLDKSESQK